VTTPDLTAVIEQYRAECWSGAMSVTAEEVENTCTEIAWELAGYLQNHGFPTATVAYFDTADAAGYADRSLPGPGEGHAITRLGSLLIDFTAAQYGYPEFPKMTDIASTHPCTHESHT